MDRTHISLVMDQNGSSNQDCIPWFLPTYKALTISSKQNNVGLTKFSTGKDSTYCLSEFHPLLAYQETYNYNENSHRIKEISLVVHIVKHLLTVTDAHKDHRQRSCSQPVVFRFLVK